MTLSLTRILRNTHYLFYFSKDREYYSILLKGDPAIYNNLDEPRVIKLSDKYRIVSLICGI